MLGKTQPNRRQMNQAIALLKNCIKLGESREVGKQRCLLIRKTLADFLELQGKFRQMRAQWKNVFREDPKSVEAIYRVKGEGEALVLLEKKQKKRSLSS